MTEETEKPRKRGRPRINVDVEVIETLASYYATNEDIARQMGISVDTLTRNFAEFLEKGRSNLRNKLRQIQIKEAINGNITMLIWLGKIILGQKDPSLEIKILSEEIAKMSTDELIQIAKQKVQEYEARQ